jgi:hypothetical protein
MHTRIEQQRSEQSTVNQADTRTTTKNIFTKTGYGNLIKGLATACVSGALMACGGGSDSGPSQQTLTVAKVNMLIAESAWHDAAYALECGSDGVSGCFIHPECYSSSGYYSTRMVYSATADSMSAFAISYDNSTCAGEPGIHPTVWSYWVSQVELNAADPQQGALTLSKVHYDDGFLFDANKPLSNVLYRANVWVDNNGSTRRLCLSDGLIDPARPLKFMETTAAPLDSNNCAEEFK